MLTTATNITQSAHRWA